MSQYRARAQTDGIVLIGVVAIMALTILGMFTSCAGAKVREQITLPVTYSAWQDVRVDLNAGLAAGEAEGAISVIALSELRSAEEQVTLDLERGTVTALTSQAWRLLRPWAELGLDARIASGDIDYAIKPSLTEQFDQFGDSLEILWNKQMLPRM